MLWHVFKCHCVVFKQNSVAVRTLLAFIIFWLLITFLGPAFWFRPSCTNAISAAMAKTSSSGPAVRQDGHPRRPVGWLAGRRSAESRCPAQFSPSVHSTRFRHRSALTAENRQLFADRAIAGHDGWRCSILRCSCRNKRKIYLPSKSQLLCCVF